MADINDLIIGIKFDTTTYNITYNLNSSDAKWNGVSNVTTPSVDFFDPPPSPSTDPDKQDLNDTVSSPWKGDFRTAIGLWDDYAKLSIGEVTGASDANIYAYQADLSGSGQSGATNVA